MGLGAAERVRDRVHETGKAGDAGYEESVYPPGGLRVSGSAIHIHAVSVQTDNYDCEDELNTAGSPASPGLIDVDLLGGGTLADFAGERLDCERHFGGFFILL